MIDLFLSSWDRLLMVMRWMIIMRMKIFLTSYVHVDFTGSKFAFWKAVASWHKLLQLNYTTLWHIYWGMADGISSFWGPATSITEWCEQNYVYSPYVAEFYNTMSNIPCILLALIGLLNALRQRFEKRFSVLHISNMILAIGSMLYHATLQWV